MLYLIGLIFPPLAVLMCGKPWQAILIALPLTLLFWIPGVLYAWSVAHDSQAASVRATPAADGGFFTSLCFCTVGAGIAMYWMARTAVATPN